MCWPRPLIGKARDSRSRNWHAEQFLDPAEVGLLLGSDKSEGISPLLGPGSATDAVHVGLRFVRDIKVDDVADVLDVDTASGDVGRHEHAKLPRPKRLEGVHALTLAAVPVDDARLNPAAIELAAEVIGPVFGSREDEDARHRLVLQEVEEEVRLEMGRDGKGKMGHSHRGDRSFLDLDELGVP